MEITQTHITAVNTALDRFKEQHELPTDRALADYIKTSQKTVWSWRKGHFSPLDRFLIAILVPSSDRTITSQ